MKIIALHGFLGSPKDFSFLAIPNILGYNIFLTQIEEIFSWAKRFNKENVGEKIIFGYSMGGRLALHCLIDDPKSYKMAIIIAAHPGLSCQEAQKERYLNDKRWAHKFANESFEKVVTQWDAQPILRSSFKSKKNELCFSKASLSLALRKFSLGQQEYLPEKINKLTIPILWLYPKKEEKILKDINLLNPRSRLVALDCGHRLLTEKPNEVRKLIKEFMWAQPQVLFQHL